MKKISEIINLTERKDTSQKSFVDRHKYVTREFQDYGYRIAAKLGETKNASLYIKLAKEKPRAFLDQAFSFAVDYPNAKNKGRIFMWKLKELENSAKSGEKTPAKDDRKI